MICRVTDFSNKEIININDGHRFGNIVDVVFDSETGQIRSLIVPAKRDGFSFLEKPYEYEIPWNDVEKVGDDYIFVKFDAPQRNMPAKRKSFF